MQIGNESFSSGSVSVSRTITSSALSLLDPLIHPNVRLILSHDSEVHANPDNLQLKR